MIQKTPPPQQPSPQPPTPARHFTLQLSPTRRGARLARLLSAEQLRSWGLPLDPARLVIAELANNAVQHGRVPGRDFLLLVQDLGGTLRIEVSDTRTDRLPQPQLPRPDAESGHGLTLVHALSTTWGVTEGPFPRKTVWAEIALPAPEPGTPCFGGAGSFHKEL
ncbi:ATP-binding protein [Streptomyces sp. NPDC004539]|uniref:ATP-binding protein n=1 Tax=Streptomyces sp. NPDC004539 TaxID=3154280 RepID=UPI0033A879C2